jgi:6-phospho-beta-glucosidase
MRLAVVGAGSTYTPELISGLMRERERIDVSDLILHDIDSERRDVVGGLTARILDRQGFRGSLRLTGELDRALDGADAVLIQIRVGGQAARLRDETIPAACGCVGQETTGAGGLAKALRTVPAVLHIAERTRQLAADQAWIVDFTNPVGIVTRALLDAGHRAIGLCNVAINFQRQIAAHLGVAPARVLVDQVGLNHLTWIRAVWVDGEDVLPQVIGSYGDELAEQLELPRALLERLGAIPSYYLRYFYAEREVVQEQRTATPRAQTVAEIERKLLDLYTDPALNDKPPLLQQRGGAFYSEAATQLIASLAADEGDVQVVDVRNGDTLAGLQADDVVEVPARIQAHGPVPVRQPPLAPELLGLVQHVAAYERLAASAAMSGDRDTARLALMTNPLVRDYEVADALLQRLVATDSQPPLPTPPASTKPNRRDSADHRAARDSAGHGASRDSADEPASRDSADEPASRDRRDGQATPGIVLAVDGGNVKTDLALADTEGRLLALVRGGRSSPHYEGVDGCVKLLQDLLTEATTAAALHSGAFRAEIAQILIAGADLPEELAALRAELEAREWTERLEVDNDTFALLRSGTDRGWGVAVVCGGGINCVGLAPDGRQARFPSLGAITGDWGGGFEVGMAALMAAARSADGRGPRTILESTVPAHFGMRVPFDVARALHLAQLPPERIGELARVVFPAAEQDEAAADIVRHLADEVVTLATVAMRRLELTDQAPDVVLGGGLMRAATATAIDRIAAGVRQAAPRAHIVVARSAPIVGALLLGLDAVGVVPEVAARARRELDAAFAQLEGDGARVLIPRIGSATFTAQALLRSSRG